jgi:hypothetical protein
MAKLDPTRFDTVPLGNKAEERVKQQLKAVEDFTEKHPLARVYKLHFYLTWAREDRSWKMFALYAKDFVDNYANLPTAIQSDLDPVLPHQPYVTGEVSTFAWIAYMAALRASPAGWKRLGEELRRSIVEGWGEDFLPAVFRTLSTVDYEEPPF